MKINLVLSGREKYRRFNKLRKVNCKSGQSICAVFSISLTIEEEKIIEYLYVKFKVPWPKDMLVNENQGLTSSNECLVMIL